MGVSNNEYQTHQGCATMKSMSMLQDHPSIELYFYRPNQIQASELADALQGLGIVPEQATASETSPVTFKNSPAFPHSKGAVVLFQTITAKALEQGDACPIVLLLDGSWLSSAMPPSDTEGRKVRTIFFQLISALDPAYAAITVEKPILSPYDLLQNTPFFELNHFYLNTNCFGEGLMAEVLQDIPEDQIQLLHSGVQVTMKDLFDTSVSLNAQDHERAARTARMIGEHFHPTGVQ